MPFVPESILAKVTALGIAATACALLTLLLHFLIYSYCETETCDQAPGINTYSVIFFILYSLYYIVKGAILAINKWMRKERP